MELILINSHFFNMAKIRQNISYTATNSQEEMRHSDACFTTMYFLKDRLTASLLMGNGPTSYRLILS